MTDNENSHYCIYADRECEIDVDTAYEQGRKDAIDEFIEKLLDLCSGGEECIDCVGGNCKKCIDNSVDYSSIVDLAEEMKGSDKQNEQT